MTDRARRLAAIGALLLLAVALGTTAFDLIGDLWRVPVAVLLVMAAVLAMWFALTRTGPRRFLAGLVVVVAVAAFVVVSLHGSGLVSILVRVALVLVAVALTRSVVSHHPDLLTDDTAPARTVPPARRGVLIMNVKSGGGKAERFDLAGQCRARGIAGVVLQPGDDLLDLAERAVDDGADVIGMAGGDGSQALVASVAARRGVAMVVVPAGTRNHLALDLGLDRENVVEALDAFGEAVEQSIDLGEVNGRVFVNNVSLGLYAAVVRSPEYRAAKVDTALGALPAALGPGSAPFDLRFTGPDGETHDGAHVVQVSNNPYGRAAGTRTTRPRLDTGRLGVVALVLRGDRDAAAFLAALAVNRPERFRGFLSWEATTFRVDSDDEIDVGLDGEALQMRAPLDFRVRPGALRVRRPLGRTSHVLPRELGLRSTIRVVVQAAFGGRAPRPLARPGRDREPGPER
ncbi:diacylglycerol kinase family protein [Actinomycetospora sp. TBRC 11914]|uniref:diacylglycerol/lipid kinase family protein n=1 Tax=Actinomycetospora sp. TBRC 11914 TaxID=2729387 RepID=UPI00145D599A|nr:diacylglycerol kinase family protein [Actinomycetospora sp. TBRC 11914]NMO88287.1 diacylglycerol kinase [Actinomycetospora sp. TBRC 11914]